MKWTWLLIFLWIWPNVASAKTPPKPKPTTATVQTVTNPFLWSVKGPKAKAESYLFGTVHIGVSSKEMPKSVWAALRKSGTFVSEADTSTVDATKIRKFLFYQPPQTLTKALGKEKTQTVAKALGSTVESIQNMRPWFVSSLIVLKLETNPKAMLDTELQAAAGKGKKKSVFLETYEEQLQMLSGLDEKLMLESLHDIASNMDQARADYTQMTKIYRAGDAKKLSAFMQKELAKVAGMEAELLQQRNKNWVPKLESLFAKGPTFVAVGAAHLVGPGSVVERLKKNGFVIKRIR